MVFSVYTFLAAPNHQHMQGFSFLGVDTAVTPYSRRLGSPQLCRQLPSDPTADPLANTVESQLVYSFIIKSAGETKA